MNELEIRIIGRAGAGKSIMAQHLANYLKVQHGFKVSLMDERHVVDLNDPIEAMLPETFDAKITVTTELP